jgi:hypothetical protein
VIEVVPPAVPALRFTLEEIVPLRAAAPALRMRVRLATGDGVRVRGVGLNVDVRIAAERRRYATGERDRLRELFGAPGDWASSLGPIPWLRAGVHVPPFDGATTIDVPLPCGYDFDLVADKYATALDGGEIPVDVGFTGTLFYAGSDGRLQTAKIPWDSELSARVPLSVWREAVAAAFGSEAWLRVGRDALQQLQAFRSQGGFATWDQTFASLLERAEA